MSTVPKTLTIDKAALHAAQSAADAAGMTLSAYTSRALRKQAVADNLDRAAAFLASRPADEQRAMDALLDAHASRAAGLTA